MSLTEVKEDLAILALINTIANILTCQNTNWIKDIPHHTQLELAKNESAEYSLRLLS